MTMMIKRLARHIVWFNRKSPHFVFGNWFEYVWGYKFDNPFQHPEHGWNQIFSYVIYYPIALVKFLWFSRKEILK